MTDLDRTLAAAVSHYGFAMPDTFLVDRVNEDDQSFHMVQGFHVSVMDYYLNTHGEIIHVREAHSFSIDPEDYLEDTYNDLMDLLME